MSRFKCAQPLVAALQLQRSGGIRMRVRFTALVRAVVLLGMTASPAHASDIDVFDKLVERSAPSLVDLFDKFTPRVACACPSGVIGVVATNANLIWCWVPSFVNGDLVSFSACSAGWAPVSR